MRIFINLFVGVMSFGAWIGMALLSGNGMLSEHGIPSLKFFTVLSNLFNGAICLFYAYRRIAGKKNTYWEQMLKLIGTTAVGLTFMTVMAFLGPLYGYPMMFKGSNFWLHLVLPVMSMLSFMLLEFEYKIPLRRTWIAILPTVAYEIGYLTNIGLNGIGIWPDTNDFYGFLSWGAAGGAVIAVTILLVTWGIALVLCAVGNRRRK